MLVTSGRLRLPGREARVSCSNPPLLSMGRQNLYRTMYLRLNRSPQNR
jgi:hypothetical protein